MFDEWISSFEEKKWNKTNFLESIVKYFVNDIGQGTFFCREGKISSGEKLNWKSGRKADRKLNGNYSIHHELIIIFPILNTVIQFFKIGTIYIPVK